MQDANLEQGGKLGSFISEYKNFYIKKSVLEIKLRMQCVYFNCK